MNYYYKNISDKIIKELDSNELNSSILLLNGPPGVGKTEVIKCIANTLYNNEFNLEENTNDTSRQSIAELSEEKKTEEETKLNQNNTKEHSIDALISLSNTYNANNAVFVVDLFHNTKIDVFAKNINHNKAKAPVVNYDLNESEYNYELFNNEFDKIIREDQDLAKLYKDIFRYTSFGFKKENKSYLQEKISIVNDYIRENNSKKSIQRILLEPNKVSVESLIVDLMNVFYSDITSGKIEGIRPSSKVKVVITIDNFDQINESINTLLFDYLFEYAFFANFNDFTSYNIYFPDPSIKVSDFFDFRFVYSFRSSISKYFQKQKSKYQDKIKQFAIKYLTENDLADYPPKLISSLSEKELIKFTGGIQRLVFSEVQSLDIKTDNLPKELSKLAYNTIKGELTEKQELMLYCLAFGYDENPAFNKKCNEIYSFDSMCHNLLKYNLYLTKGSAELGLSEEIKLLIKEYLKLNLPEDYANINNLFYACSLIPDIVDKLKDDEFSLLVVLSFIPKENNLELSRLVLYKRINEIDELYSNHKYLFPNEKYYIDKTIAERIKNYVKQSDPEFYTQLINIPNKYSNRIEEEKQRIINQKTAQMLSYEKELRNLESKYSNENNTYKKHQEVMMEYENQMIKVRQQINDKSFYNNFLVSMISTFITVTVLIFAIVLPKIFITDGPNSPVFSIQFILFALVVVIAILDYIFIKRTIISYKNKDKNKEFKQKLEDLEQEKNAIMEKMAECKEKMEIFENRKKELENLINL